MQEYLLDTNVLIYLFAGKPDIVRSLDALKRNYFFISTISYFEFLSGAKTPKQYKRLEKLLQKLVPLDFRKETAKAAIKIQKENPKRLTVKDLFIAATAQTENLTLVTADKDFQRIKGLNVKLIRIAPTGS